MPLKNLMETLLAVGNYMNGGTEEGQADGFTIGTMNKLKEIQDQVRTDVSYEHSTPNLTKYKIISEMRCLENPLL